MMQKQLLKAGTAIIDISPEIGVQLAGYPHCPRPNKGIHDPLYACCLCLDNGVKEAIFVTMDLLYFGKAYVKKLREKFGHKIMFTTTHTHSGPWASEVLASELEAGIRIDEKYTDALLGKLEAVINEALNNKFEAKAGAYVGHCGTERGVGGNRREKGGICDPSVNVLAVSDKNDVIRACLVNYSLHPTFLHAENELVTSDYPAYIRRYLSYAYPEAVVMFAQGTSGNQSSRYHRTAQDFEEAARVGTTIGIEADNCIRKIEFENKIKITNQNCEIELPMKTYPSIEEAEKAVKAATDRFESMKSADYISMRNAELTKFGAENNYAYSKLAAAGYKSPELPYEIQIININDIEIIGLQGELFVEYGLRLKSSSQSAKTFVFSVTNGACPGYVYTPEATLQGDYEVGTSMLAKDAGEVILSTIKGIRERK